MNTIETIIIILFSIICAISIPDAQKYSVYANPEQELAFQLEHERVEHEFQLVMAEDAERIARLDVLENEIRIAYCIYSVCPIPGKLSDFITTKVNEFNKLSECDGEIGFNEDTPVLSINRLSYSVSYALRKGE